TLAPVPLGRLPRDIAAHFKATQDAAQVAGIEAKVLGNLGRGRLVAMDDLIEDARLGERELALVDTFLQQPDALGVETIESPDRGDALGKSQIRIGSNRQSHQDASSSSIRFQLYDIVN